MDERYRFSWPDPEYPNIVTRDLTILRKGKKETSVKLTGVKLRELIPYCLYEVPESSHEQAGAIPELRPGRILSRNLKISEGVYGGSVEEEMDQCFISYDGIYKARRGLSHIERRYISTEIPGLRKWSAALDSLTRFSWDLEKSNQEGRQILTSVSAHTAIEHGSVIDSHKVAARERTVQAGTLEDSNGRFNPGRIPLICFAGERKLRKRTQIVRGIGRKMSFREVVLEQMIDGLRDICISVSRSQEYRLRSGWLTQSLERTPRKVKQEADRLLQEAMRLRHIVTRPFARSFNRCAVDLEDAAQFLQEAANNRRSELISQAKEKIGQVYRAMKQLECHWRLEEVLFEISILRDRKQTVSALQQRLWHRALESVHHQLTAEEPLTGKHLEHGFKRPVLQRVRPHIQLADKSLMQDPPDFRSVYKELKTACDPI
ncbi:hypothetical protein HYV70_00395 [Candidatus Uhrbacteria bacterium]|nr:hypothetical protein [Candidatus Uhrbacteria bacterium]